MAIPEATLENWSHQGSVQQSAATYQTIKSVLESPLSPYARRAFSIFLQGSYGNDTNIRADSDVDIVICTSEMFYYNTEALSPLEKSNFNQAYPGSSSYSFDEFKREVATWLAKHFGSAVDLGSKAIHIRGEGNRRNADVLVAADFRHYWKYQTYQTPIYSRGIVFWKTDGTKIVNYPKQHSDNCTLKHQETKSWFKPMVRVMKNMRNRMIQEGALNVGVAPSYYLEGLLSNIPNHCFAHTYERSFLQAINYLQDADLEQMTCANGIHWLIRDGQPVCWSSTHFVTFMRSAIAYWNNYN